MNPIHPKTRLAAILAAILSCVAMAGCRNQPTGMANPFLAPDRVPPPATRALLPGQAQPYYPGDPLPVMQSAVQPQQPTSSSGALTWTGPSGTAAAPRAEPTSKALAFSNEPTVAVPSDNDDLRFALPKPPEPEPITPIASAPSDGQSPQFVAAPAQQTVVPASYNAPIPSTQSFENNAALQGETEATASGPWRSPQISPASSPMAYGVLPPMFPAIAPVLPQPNTMDVRLRAVPSPPPEPVELSTPRIRLPGYAEPQPWTGGGAAMQPMQPTFGQMPQTVQIGPLPPPPYDPTINLAATPQLPGGPDGFRPRSSMR